MPHCSYTAYSQLTGGGTALPFKSLEMQNVQYLPGMLPGPVAVIIVVLYCRFPPSSTHIKSIKGTFQNLC